MEEIKFIRKKTDETIGLIVHYRSLEKIEAWEEVTLERLEKELKILGSIEATLKQPRS